MNTQIMQNMKMLRRNLWTSARHNLKVKVGDININYESTGCKGNAALCLPGSMGCVQTDFSPQIEGLRDKNINAIFWDPPGYGQSRPPGRDFSSNFFLKDAEKASELMRVLGHEKYSLLGWSDGGITALQMALLYPASVSKLVVWGANAFIDETDLKLYEKVRNVDDWSERMRKPMEDIYGKDYFKEKWEQWIDAMIRIYREQNGQFFEKDISNISCPTLIIHGAKDPMVGEDHAQFLHKNIKNSELVIWANGKHNLHLKFASDFNDLVADFLNK